MKTKNVANLSASVSGLQVPSAPSATKQKTTKQNKYPDQRRRIAKLGLFAVARLDASFQKACGYRSNVA